MLDDFIENHIKGILSVCAFCGKEYLPGDTGTHGITCSDSCHENLVSFFEERFGKDKKVTKLSNGKSYRVPFRDIIEKGIHEQELDQYPEWMDDEQQG